MTVNLVKRKNCYQSRENDATNSRWIESYSSVERIWPDPGTIDRCLSPDHPRDLVIGRIHSYVPQRSSNMLPIKP